jgi:hypothetical protein
MHDGEKNDILDSILLELLLLLPTIDAGIRFSHITDLRD